MLETPGYGRVMGRVSRVTEDGQISGYQLYLFDSGKWELRTATQAGVIAAGKVPFSLNTWHHLDYHFARIRSGRSLTTTKWQGLRTQNTRLAWQASGTRGITASTTILKFGRWQRAYRLSRNRSRSTETTGPPAVPPPPLCSQRFEPIRALKLVSGGGGNKLQNPVRDQRGRVQVRKIDPGALTSYKITTLTNGTTYFFVVEGVNSAGKSKPSNSMSAVPLP